jgi:sortase A
VEISTEAMKRLKIAVAVCMAQIGLCCLAFGVWIPFKAALAQVLIAEAWSESRGKGEESVRPWPWADTWPVAKLTVPRLEKEVYVLASASGQSLAFGPGHWGSSAAPGEMDNVVIAGHRDTHFEFLRELREGDDLLLESRTGIQVYRVSEWAVVHESRVEILEPSGEPELTLITCFPFDAVVPGGPLRFVVFASFVTSEGTFDRNATSAPKTQSRSRGPPGPRGTTRRDLPDGLDRHRFRHCDEPLAGESLGAVLPDFSDMRARRNLEEGLSPERGSLEPTCQND